MQLYVYGHVVSKDFGFVIKLYKWIVALILLHSTQNKQISISIVMIPLFIIIKFDIDIF